MLNNNEKNKITSNGMKVMKFGGTSVAHASNINKVIDIITEALKKQEKIVVVVSAFSGITDDLILLANLASKKNRSYQTVFKGICGRHDQAIRELIGPENEKKGLLEIRKKYDELEKITENIF